MGKQVQWIALAVLIVCSLHASAAPTWKKGVTIPVVTEGSVCNSATDKIAVTATNQILSCQSDGTWRKAQGTGGTGLRGLLLPVAGKSISCSDGWLGSGSASVDASGNITLGYKYDGGMQAWQYATNVGRVGYNGNYTLLTPAGIEVWDTLNLSPPRAICFASWPVT